MVKDYIATEVGDKIIAKLINPYLKVNRILDWNIKAGFSSEFTVGKLTFTEGSTLVTGNATNLDLNNGDILLAGGFEFEVEETPNEKNLILKSPSPISLVDVSFYVKANEWNYFSYEYRWSQYDKPDGG